MNLLITSRAALFILAGSFLFSFTTIADKTSFAGSWVLNEGKSELGNFGRFAARKIKVEQKEDAIGIAKTSPSPGGDDVTTTETLTFDGKASETTVFGGSKKKSAAKWSEDGKSLVISYTIAFERNGQTFDINGTETWTLTNEGKSLSVQTVSTSPQGERSTKALYDKE
ncbi:MAG: hypothetical protein JNK14_13960 [Chitinophagaceae bacterium]|nr:hypothetical protein [Chitinophagaceae bacterium]